MAHYHIRWSGSKLDWEVFNTREEAEVAAGLLVRPKENYTIEEFDTDCPLCSENREPQSRMKAPRAKKKKGR